ncbi:hypothetical protein D3C84_1169370 [compost metagenome]
MLGLVAVAVLQIGGHRQRRRLDDRAGIAQGFLTADRAFPITPAKGKRQAGAGRGQRLETQRSQHLRRTGIPRVG